MTNVREARYDPNPCLNCGEQLDAFAAGSTPISICAHCGHVMALTPDLKHRELTSEELGELAGDKEMMMLLDLAAKWRAKR